MGEWFIDTPTVVERDTVLTALEILPGGELRAPTGKNLTVTVNGVGITPEPGRYVGQIVLSVRDAFWRRTMRFGIPTDSNYRMGVCVVDGKYRPECSVQAIVRGGTVSDGEASDVCIESREWDFNGIYITGDTAYTVNRAKIDFTGDGTDDFVGLGAGIAASGRARVTVNDSAIHTRGITRGALFVGGEAEVTLNDCELSICSYVPTPEQLEAGKKLERMMEPPWSMSIRGNGRTLNLAERGVLHLNHCHVVSNSWGVLSVDGAQVNRMYVKDSLIELKGESGYGCFSIADDLMYDYKAFGDAGCFDVIDHSVIRVPTYGIIMSLGTAGGEFKNGAVVESGRHGAFIFRNCGLLKVNSGATFRTKKCCFLVKGSNVRIEADNAVLEPENGVILRLMDNDDTGMEGHPFRIPVGEEDHPIEGRDLTKADPAEDVFFSMSNMSAKGSIYNSTTDLKACTRVPPPAPDAPPPPDVGQIRGFLGDELQGAKNLDVRLKNVRLTGVVSCAKAAYEAGLETITKENCEQLGEITETPAAPVNNGLILTLCDNSVWTLPSSCWLTALHWEAGCEIRAENGRGLYMTVDGRRMEMRPGDYAGQIELRIEE